VILVRQIPKVSGRYRENSRLAETIRGDLARSRLPPTNCCRLQSKAGRVGCRSSFSELVGKEHQRALYALAHDSAPYSKVTF
jgi:hypothetical protein